MASVSSTSSSMSSASSLRGYGGLVSGLDRDTLIENFTAATRAKIAKQQKSMQTLKWKQEAYRSVSDKLVSFSRKYMSYTNSSTNLSSTNFWSRSDITAKGTNSKYVSVSGSSSIVDSVSISGVKQLAKAASMSSKDSVSDGILSTEDLSLVDGGGNLTTEAVSNLEGQYITVKYGTKAYTVKFKSGTDSDGFTYDYSDGKSTVESINRALKNVSIGDGKTLVDVIDVTASSDTSTFTLDMKSTDTAGNTILINGGSQTALESLGIVGTGVDIDDLSDSQKTITASGFSSTITSRQDFYTDQTFAQRVGGKNISFTLDGTTKSVTFMSQEELETKLAGKTNAEALEIIRNDLNEKLNKPDIFQGRVTVGVDGSKLTFKTTNPDGSDNTTSVLAMTAGDTGVLGESGALKVAYGESNRLNLTAKLSESGLKDIETNLTGKQTETTYFTGAYKALEAIENLGSKVTDSTSIDSLKTLIKSNFSTMSDSDLSSINEALDYFKTQGASTVKDLNDETTGVMYNYVDERELKLTINGEDIKGLSYNSTIKEIMSKINSANTGVTASYMNNADKFSIVSTVGGAAGKVEISGADANMLFGQETTDYTVSKGQDAIVAVKYAGSEEAVELTRGNNAFNLDGLNITVSGTFGYDYVNDSTNGDFVKKDDGSYAKIADTTKRYDSDGTENAAGDYVKTEDGECILESNGLYSYTSENNTDTVTFDAKVNSDTIVETVTDMIKDLNEIIALVNDEVSTKPNRDYEPLTDEQKEDMSEDQIKAWETKAKTGLLFADSDLRGLSDSLRFIFNTGSDEKSMLSSFGITTSTDYGDNGKLVFDETKFRAALESNPEDVKELFTKLSNDATGEQGGLMDRLSTITEKYASTTGATKGILIEKAGSTYAPTSVLSNYLQKSIDSTEDYIDRLKDQLKTEQDRYIKKFTNLETVISQMNSQSSWLTSSFSS